MKPQTMKIVKGLLAIIAGIAAGSIVNAGIILLCNALFGVPEGMDFTDPASVKLHAGELTTANYLGTLLAHQLGTIVGALVAARIAPVRKMIVAMAVGIWFFCGGIYAISLIPAPTWFSVTDLVCYLPLAFMAGKLGGRTKVLKEHETGQDKNVI